MYVFVRISLQVEAVLGPKTEEDLKPSKGKVHKSIQALFSIQYIILWAVYVACVHVCCGQSADSAKTHECMTTTE